MRSEFEISKNRDYTSYDKDHKFGLSEHYYGEDVDQKFEDAIQKVLHNLDVFWRVNGWKRYNIISKRQKLSM